jgi:hypothetical protein
MIIKPDFPVTGPRAASHDDAAQAQRVAQDQLDGVKVGKAAAANLPAGGSGEAYRQKADNARRNKWPTNGFDAVHNVKRTTS